MCSRFLCSTAEPTISLRFFGKTQSQKQVEFHCFINIILRYTYCSVIVKFSSSFQLFSVFIGIKHVNAHIILGTQAYRYLVRGALRHGYSLEVNAFVKYFDYDKLFLLACSVCLSLENFTKKLEKTPPKSNVTSCLKFP